MNSYTKIGEITEGTRQALLMVTKGRLPNWEYCIGPDRNYKCWTVSPQLMFVSLGPDGFVDAHVDHPKKGKRLNIILQTNDQCFNWITTPSEIDGEELVLGQRLEERGIYSFDATLKHWATNKGTTERIVLVETLSQ